MVHFYRWILKLTIPISMWWFLKDEDISWGHKGALKISTVYLPIFNRTFGHLLEFFDWFSTPDLLRVHWISKQSGKTKKFFELSINKKQFFELPTLASLSIKIWERQTAHMNNPFVVFEHVLKCNWIVGRVARASSARDLARAQIINALGKYSLV